jgi:hypothetical protein
MMETANKLPTNNLAQGAIACSNDAVDVMGAGQ